MNADLKCPYCDVTLTKLAQPVTFTPASPRAHREVTATHQCEKCKLLFQQDWERL